MSSDAARWVIFSSDPSGCGSRTRRRARIRFLNTVQFYQNVFVAVQRWNKWRHNPEKSLKPVKYDDCEHDFDSASKMWPPRSPVGCWFSRRPSATTAQHCTVLRRLAGNKRSSVKLVFSDPLKNEWIFLLTSDVSKNLLKSKNDYTWRITKKDGTQFICWGYPRGPYPRIVLSRFPLGVRYLTITVLGKICPFLLTKICENSNHHRLYIISHEQMNFTQDLRQPLHFMKNICSQKSVFVWPYESLLQ